MRNICSRLLLSLCLLVGVAADAWAQTIVVNPRAVRWEQSDHASPLSQAAEYEVGFFAPGASAPVQASASIARTVPTVAGTTLELPFTALPSYPIATVLEVKVRARNTGGVSAWSGASGPFGRPGPPAAPTAVQAVP
jgi:hypothetical protein